MPLDLTRGEKVILVPRRSSWSQIEGGLLWPSEPKNPETDSLFGGTAPSQFAVGSKGRKSGIGRRGTAGISPRGSDKNLYRIRTTSLKAGQIFQKEIGRRVALAWFLLFNPGLAAASEPDIVDLDQPVQLSYTPKTIRKFSIGSRPGEIGVKPLPGMGQFTGPNDIYLDWKDNIYIDDMVNRRIQKFDEAGRFLEVVLEYPSGFGVGQISVDLRQRLFVNISTPRSKTVDEIWELSKGKVVKKYAKERAPKIKLPEPGATDIRITRSRPKIIDVSYKLTAGSKQRSIGFRSVHEIINFEVVSVTTGTIFFRAFAQGQQLYYEAPLDKGNGRLIAHPEKILPLDMGAWRITNLSAQGKYYAVHYAEFDGESSGQFTAEIIAVAPVPK